MQTKNPASKHFFAVFSVAIAIAAAGCGDENKADLVNGKTLFVEKCGACHTLERAGTKGVVGPNLDNSFHSARADGMTADTVASVVDGQIQFPGPTGASVPDQYVMPADIVTGEDARDVAAYVGLVAGVEGQDEGRLASAGGGGDGKSIFTQNCGSCHALTDAGTAGATGPKLDGIGKQGKKYIETSIEDPDAKIAAGFAKGVMPTTYGTQLTPEELQALVEYLLDQKK